MGVTKEQILRKEVDQRKMILTQDHKCTESLDAVRKVCELGGGVCP